MSLLISHVVTGVECDVRGCDARITTGEPLPYFSEAHRNFEWSLFCQGWVQRISRSNRWYCRGHAPLAYRCTRRYCGPRTNCPVHGHGQVREWETENAKRLRSASTQEPVPGKGRP